ncbi:thioesterase family protein [Pseudobutyrivibrio xylanivorans]|uniref:Thioesterase n=1 Tax=Pseudobutyrivibrio xylanivorans TaxID=185007 RepID=A0A5P6VW57_PSEXY|nr:thioesterase family protein [Pseudobutyrivibrio xylanivorans]QFJ55971.1 thioesterase [Pseudobutyrivibrio xylanivorans]
MLEIGMKGTGKTLVTLDNTAKAFTSGALDVFATPAMIALMEETCWKMIQPELEEGFGSVGTKIDVSHTAPSTVGKTVTCEATLKEIDGRKLTFEVSCSDENGPVGRGVHERFIIDNEKFMNKASSN